MTSSPSTVAPTGAVDRFFKITERGSTIGAEIRGGLVTFAAMAYIIALNPLIIGTVQDGTGKFLGGSTDTPNLAMVAAVTALAAGVLSILMGVVANYPMALAAGLGLNAVVAFQIATIDGMTWADAMGIVVLEGLVILVLVLTGFRTAVFRAVPRTLKTAISVGIGLFITLIGLVNAGFVRKGEGTPLELGIGGSLQTWPVLVFVLGLTLAIILTVRGVRGAMLISIAAATVVALVVEAVAKLGSSAVNPKGWNLNVPALDGSPVAVPDFGLLGQFSLFGSIGKIGIVAVVLLVFSLLLADFFDTMGTMVAVGSEAKLLDADGNPPKSTQILVVDSVAAAVGGMASASSNTSYVESTTGVAAGARTGLAAVVTGVCFLLATFLAPLVNLIPNEAAAPALVIVGYLMMTQVLDIDWKSPDIAIPAFLTLAIMPFAYSITAGIGVGFIAHVVIKVATGKVRSVHPLMWVASLMFVVYFTLVPLQNLLGI